jgi:uncharacterized protein YodC (DUF2158 family)
MPNIKKGDVVRLKSGGPSMTVENVANDRSGNPTVWVTWFDGPKSQKATYDPDALEVVPPGGSSGSSGTATGQSSAAGSQVDGRRRARGMAHESAQDPDHALASVGRG